ncbi:GNAT family N-acetyltransferase [Spongiibacter nanhainus]|uniref:GNAT family N-acetyltransferase n=1 Tax=Spongiibacter nanhainus TaxID=2794344 RepID=A0A7T4UPN3_9GAMM|nr:MSMEG_0567/Sll0786 family nitrogen starvation N-acetyltransferase [Spongiibacter nanhainus]QQD17213.1 GNAT family N-acetyltransferase [Spongiibacter nanhainus]
MSMPLPEAPRSEIGRTTGELPYTGYTIKWASAPWEVDAAHDLRRRVFCGEQGLFVDDDIDAVDRQAQVLVALGSVCGCPQEVVATVRIHQEAPGTWYGSRLAVDSAYRRQGQLGASLIKLAVSSAHALGCECFLANVQLRNEPLFRRLHWRRIGSNWVCGQEHALMQADLRRYPPIDKPYQGFMVCNRRPSRRAAGELFPSLLAVHGEGGK